MAPRWDSFPFASALPSLVSPNSVPPPGTDSGSHSASPPSTPSSKPLSPSPEPSYGASSPQLLTPGTGSYLAPFPTTPRMRTPGTPPRGGGGSFVPPSPSTPRSREIAASELNKLKEEVGLGDACSAADFRLAFQAELKKAHPENGGNMAKFESIMSSWDRTTRLLAVLDNDDRRNGSSEPQKSPGATSEDPKADPIMRISDWERRGLGVLADSFSCSASCSADVTGGRVPGLPPKRPLKAANRLKKLLLMDRREAASSADSRSVQSAWESSRSFGSPFREGQEALLQTSEGPDVKYDWSPKSAAKMGDTAFLQRNFTAAVELYSIAMAMRPMDAGLVLCRSAAQYKKGSYSQALSDARRAIRLRPTWPKAHYRLGLVHKALGQLAAAVASFRRALELEEDPSPALVLLTLKAEAVLSDSRQVAALKTSPGGSPTSSLAFQPSLAALDFRNNDFESTSTPCPNSFTSWASPVGSVFSSVSSPRVKWEQSTKSLPASPSGEAVAKVVVKSRIKPALTLDLKCLESSGFEEPGAQENFHSDSAVSYSREPSSEFGESAPLFVTGSEDGTVSFWNSATWQKVDEQKPHQETVTEVLWSPEGNVVATASEDGTICVWKVCSRGERDESFFEGEPEIEEDPSAQKSISVRWVLTSHTDSITGMSFNSDGSCLVSISADKTARLWNVELGKLLDVYEGHEGALTSVTVSLDDAFIATASVDSTVKIWDTTQGKCVHTIEGPAGCALTCKFFRFSHRFQDAGKHYFASSQNNANEEESWVNLWLVKEDEPNLTVMQRSQTQFDQLITAVEFYQMDNGAVLAAIALADGKLSTWNLCALGMRAQCLHILQMPDQTPIFYTLRFSPSGDCLAACGMDKRVKVWRLSNGELEHWFKGHSKFVTSVAWSSDGRLLASTSADETVRVWSGEAQSEDAF